MAVCFMMLNHRMLWFVAMCCDVSGFSRLRGEGTLLIGLIIGHGRHECAGL